MTWQEQVTTVQTEKDGGQAVFSMLLQPGSLERKACLDENATLHKVLAS